MPILQQHAVVQLQPWKHSCYHSSTRSEHYMAGEGLGLGFGLLLPLESALRLALGVPAIMLLPVPVV
jgi:hypothetical protein